MDRLKAPLRVVNTLALLVIAYALLAQPSSAAPSAGTLAAPMGPGFEYEGRLGTLSGAYDFQFRLFDAATGGALVSTIVSSSNNIAVDRGEYVLTLKFGDAVAGLLSGQALYLEVKYRLHTTSTSAPYTTLAGARPPLMPSAYAMSLRAGAQIKGALTGSALTVRNNGSGYGIWGTAISSDALRGNSTSGTGVYGQSGTGIGVYGESTSYEGVRGVGHNQYHAGVFGNNTAGGFGVYGLSATGAGVVGESTSWLGVYGASTSQTGVAGKSTTASGTTGESRDYYGVYGTSTNGEGVRGVAQASGRGGVVGINNGGGDGYGVYGSSNNVGVWGVGTNNAGVYATSTNGNAVQAVVNNPNTLGVWAVNNAGGFALGASGNASQSLGSGGFVKAMALFDPYNGADPIQQCFNSQLAGTAATSGNCGFGFSVGSSPEGARTINFGFNVADRFISVTPFSNPKGDISSEIYSVSGSTVQVKTFYSLIHSDLHDDEIAQGTYAKFFIIVY